MYSTPLGVLFLTCFAGMYEVSASGYSVAVMTQKKSVYPRKTNVFLCSGIIIKPLFVLTTRDGLKNKSPLFVTPLSKLINRNSDDSVDSYIKVIATDVVSYKFEDGPGASYMGSREVQQNIVVLKLETSIVSKYETSEEIELPSSIGCINWQYGLNSYRVDCGQITYQTVTTTSWLISHNHYVEFDVNFIMGTDVGSAIIFIENNVLTAQFMISKKKTNNKGGRAIDLSYYKQIIEDVILKMNANPSTSEGSSCGYSVAVMSRNRGRGDEFLSIGTIIQPQFVLTTINDIQNAKDLYVTTFEELVKRYPGESVNTYVNVVAKEGVLYEVKWIPGQEYVEEKILLQNMAVLKLARSLYKTFPSSSSICFPASCGPIDIVYGLVSFKDDTGEIVYQQVTVSQRFDENSHYVSFEVENDIPEKFAGLVLVRRSNNRIVAQFMIVEMCNARIGTAIDLSFYIEEIQETISKLTENPDDPTFMDNIGMNLK